jgi:hypothetical protein
MVVALDVESRCVATGGAADHTDSSTGHPVTPAVLRRRSRGWFPGTVTLSSRDSVGPRRVAGKSAFPVRIDESNRMLVFVRDAT